MVNAYGSAMRSNRSIVVRRWFAGVILLIGLPVVGACFASGGGGNARGGEKSVRRQTPGGSGRVEMENVKIPTRDGQWLAADIWLPKGSGRYPAVLIMTPYNRKLLGASLPDPQAELELPDLSGYAFVMVDWRGFFGSKPASGLRRATMADHAKDGHDVIEWIARQKWSDGKVGLWGPSATGKVQYVVAAEKPPHLRCIVPLTAAYGYSYEQFYFGGVLRSGYVSTLGKVGYGPQTLVKMHPTKDTFWKRIEKSSRNVPAIDVPALLITGWYDLDVDSVIGTYQDLVRHGGEVARKETRLVIGPWHHTALGKERQSELSFPQAMGVPADESTRFFDVHLRGERDAAGEAPPVRYFEMGTNRWHGAASFPPATEGQTHYYLAADSALVEKPPTDRSSGETFRFDPTDPSPTRGGMNAFIPKDPNYKTVGSGPRDQRVDVESRSDCLLYTSGALKRSVALGGNATVRLFVTSDRFDTDFAVRLCDVHPDGRSMLVTDGILRMRFRDGLDRPGLMKPGKVYEVTVTLAVTSHVFLEGHRIRIIVGSANWPRFDVNLNLDRKRLLAPRGVVATNQVFHDRDRPSVLTLPRWKKEGGR